MRYKGKKIIYNGMLFDSLLELKFVLMVEERCAYIRTPFTIWYNKQNLNLTDRNECPNKYTPDFLVRKIRTGTAHLIEVKPRKYVTDEEVQFKRGLAERYIQRKGHDWKFNFVTERQVDNTLTELQRRKFSEVLKTRKKGFSKMGLMKQSNKYSNEVSKLYDRIPDSNWILDFVDEREYVYWVKKGRYKIFE